MKRLLTICLLFLSIVSILAATSLEAREMKKDWDDLFEEDRRYYGSEKEEKFAINAFFVEKEDWQDHYSLMVLWLFRTTEYPRYSSFRFFPFYYSLHSKVDERRRYVTPLLYHHVNGPEKLWITPLNGTIINEWNEGDTGFRETTWWAPLLPLTWHHKGPRGGHRTYVPLLNYSWSTDKGRDRLERMWLLPLLFWSRDRGDLAESYLHLVPPLYLSGRSGDGGSYRHVLWPLYLSWKSVLSYSGEWKPDGMLVRHNLKMRESSFSPLWGSVREKQYHDEGGSTITASSFWFPLIPLFYRSREGDGDYHYNVLWFLDWGGRGSSTGRRFWLAPLYFGKGGDAGYRHIVPLLYFSGWERDSSSGSSYRHVIPPLYLSWTSRDDTTGPRGDGPVSGEQFVLLSLLGGYARYDHDMINSREETQWRYIWFPIVPLYFSGYDRHEGSHRNLFWLVDWKRDSNGSLERFWFMPFFFYGGGGDGYRAFVPFYFRPSGNTDDKGWSAGLFHYHAWSGNERTLWMWPWYSWKEREKKRHYRHFLPLYYSWQLKESSGSFFIPFSISYETKYRSIHLNATGFSRSTAVGPFSPSLFPAKYHGKWYLDTDFSWFYDVFSISSRVAIENPFKDRQSEHDNPEVDTAAEIEKQPDDKKVALHRQKTFDRENSESFWGMKLLFGWFAIEKGGSKRHVRLLPLSWLTWDKESRDRMYVVPPLFLYYNNTVDDLRYLVVFPFYGSEKEGASYKRAYLLNLFWDEYFDDEKRHEKSVLWPLANWYDSPARSGWRVIPLMWHRKTRGNGEVSSRYISPFLYHRSVHGMDDGGLKYSISVNPLYYRKKTADRNREYATLKIPLLPLMSFTTEKYKYYDTPPVTEKMTGKKTVTEPVLSRTRTHAYNWIFPFYYYSRDMQNDLRTGREERESLLVGLPFLYRDSWRVSGTTGDSGERKITGSLDRFFLLGYYRERENERIMNSFLFGLWKTEKDGSTGGSLYSLLYGLFRGYSSPEETSTWLLPVYSYRRDAEKKRVTALAGTFIHSRYAGEGDTGDRSLYLGYGLASWGTYHEDKYLYAPAGSRYCPVTYRRHWLLPLYYHRTVSGEEDGMSYHRILHANPLWFSDREHSRIDDRQRYYSRYWFPLVPVFYRYSDEDEVHWNTLLLLDGAYKKDGSYRRTMLFPLFYRSSGSWGTHTNILGIVDWSREYGGNLEYSMVLPLYVWVPGYQSHLVLPPLLGWFSRSPEEKRSFLLGTYWRTSRYGTRQNFLYLFDHEYTKKGDEDTWDFIFGLGQYRATPSVTHSELLLGLLMDYTNYKNRPDYDFSLGWFLVTAQREGQMKSNGVFPLWYYRSEPESWWFLSIAGLTYLSKDEEGDFDMGLLGLLYYRNNESSSWSDRRMWLGGTLWNEVKKPERKYHARGMLWGILWNYETEEETGFRKFSILKGLYKRTELHGEVKQRFFWIF